MLFARLSFTKRGDRCPLFCMRHWHIVCIFLLRLALFLLADFCAVWLEANTKLREEILPARLLPVFHFAVDRWANLSILNIASFYKRSVTT